MSKRSPSRIFWICETARGSFLNIVRVVDGRQKRKEDGNETMTIKSTPQEHRRQRLVLLFLQVLVLLKCLSGVTYAFENSINSSSSVQQRRSQQKPRFFSFSLSSSSSSSSYGRGSDIWPPTNEKSRIRLADSFPNGIIPNVAKRELQQIGASKEVLPLQEYDQGPLIMEQEKGRGRKRRSAMARILRRAARRQEDNDGAPVASLRDQATTIPMIFVAALLLVSGTIPPLDCFLVTFLSMYTWILTTVANSVRNGSSSSNTDGCSTPVLPALPPTGHVPFLVRHPLGWKITHSRIYDAWLSAGVAIGLVAPFLLFCLQQRFWSVNGSAAAAALTSRPLFLLSCQAVTEAACRRRRAITPLPIRIFIPIAYNTLRLGYLGWAATTATATAATTTAATVSSSSLLLLRATSILAWTNLLYWGVNLFAFLIPVAFMRYMRAHFFAVEAASVSLRPGLQDTVQ
jgi:hypothetical protein